MYFLLPLYTLLFLGAAQKYRTDWPTALQLCLSMGIMLCWMVLGGIFLCQNQWLNSSSVLIWMALGAILACLYQMPKISKEMMLSKTNGIALILLPYFIMSAVPPWYRDSLTYHLSLPQLWASHGGYVATDEIIFSYFPQGWQSALSCFYALGAPHNPRLLVPWIVGASAFGVVGLTQIFSRDKQKQFWISGALFLLIPTVLEFGSSCYVLAPLLLFSTLAFAFHKSQDLSGLIICSACLASLKYSGLILIVLLGLSLLPEYRKGLKYLIWTALFGSFFYLKNIVLKGNPVFPLAYDIFGGEGWDSWRAWGYEQTLNNYGEGRSFYDYLVLPFKVGITQDLNYHFQGSLGPSILIVWMAAVYRSFRKEPYLLWILIGWPVIWSTQVQQIRFLLPFIPLVLALGVNQLRFKHLAMLLTASIFWSFSPTKELWNRQKTSTFISGEITDAEFLSQKLPENYPMYQRCLELNVNKVWLVWMRGYTYYLPMKYRVDSVFGAWRFEQLLEYDSEHILNTLRENQFDHILINHRFFLVDDNADTSEGRTKNLQKRFEELIRLKILKPVEQHGPIILYEVNLSL